MRYILSIVAFLVPVHSASPQGIPPLVPFERTGDLYVCDSGSKIIWRLSDLNLNGDYNDPGEVSVFYSSANGPLTLSNNAGIAVGPDGTVYVSDTTLFRILALRDLDGDGTAHGPGEAIVFFDGDPAANGSGVHMRSPQDLTVDDLGVVWVASANTGAGGLDMVLRLEDLGGAPGANDPGEALVYFAPAPVGAVGDSIPTDVKVGPDGYIYYLESGSTGVLPKGIYRLHDDVVPNGHCNDPGEASPFFIPPALGSAGFHYGMAVDASGIWYLLDHGNDVIWRLIDINGDKVITPNTPEATLYWTAPGASLNWMVEADSGVSIYTCESQNPDKILRMSDTVIANGHVNDPGEVVAVYDQTLSPTAIGNVRSLAFARSPTLFMPGTVPIGSSQSISLKGSASAPFEVWFSTGPDSQPAPPYGVLGLQVVPPHFFGYFFGGSLSPAGQFSLGVSVPNDPAAVGATLYFQAWAGFPSRVELSQMLPVTFTL